jgi:hypothetical protein
MRKKMKWLLMLLTTAVALIFLVVPTSEEVIVRVPLPLERVMNEFETPESLKKWFYPADSAGYQLSVKKANPFEFILTNTGETLTIPLKIIVSPDTTDPALTKIIYRYQRSWLSGEIGRFKEASADAVRKLAELLTTTEYVYGYKIAVATVTDSTFFFQQRIVKKINKQSETKKLFDELIARAEKVDAGYNGVRIFYSQPLNKDEEVIYGSIGVNNGSDKDPGDNIQFKMMPYGKKLLILDYEGPYGKTKDLYAVLEEYKRNNNLVSMAIPFQKFLTPGYDFADSQVVKTRISYPIF